MNKQNADCDSLRDPKIIQIVSLSPLPARVSFVLANSKLLQFSEHPRLFTPLCFAFYFHCLRCPFLTTYLGTTFMSQKLGLIYHLVKGGSFRCPFSQDCFPSAHHMCRDNCRMPISPAACKWRGFRKLPSLAFTPSALSPVPGTWWLLDKFFFFNKWMAKWTKARKRMI